MKRLLLVPVCFLTSFALGQVLRLPRPAPPPPEQPDIALPDPDPAFSLRVHLFNVRWGGLGTRNHGYGSGNLIDAARLQGFNFAFECEVPFMPNAAPADTYQARWKKPSYQLEILTVDVQGAHVHTCTLQLALESRPFDDINRAHYEHGVSSALNAPWSDPDFAYEKPDPDYPLQFHVIDGRRTVGRPSDRGWGNANISDPAPGTALQGADYNYDCGHGFITSSQIDNYYQARWTKPGQEIELLLQRAGSDKVDTCKVAVQLKPDPYPEPRLRAQVP